MEKQIYEAPAGATIKRVTTDNNRVVIEFEEESRTKEEFKPKNGDVVSVVDRKKQRVFGVYDEIGSPLHFAIIGSDVVSPYSFVESKRLLTHAERCAFFEALTNAGWKWNSKKMVLTKKEWQTKYGDVYFAPTPTGADFYYAVKWENDCDDKRWLSMGLVYRTKEEAITRAKQMLNMPK